MGDAPTRDDAVDDAASTSYASAFGNVAQGWNTQEWSFDSLTTTISAKASEALQELNSVDVRAMAETIAERASVCLNYLVTWPSRERFITLLLP